MHGGRAQYIVTVYAISVINSVSTTPSAPIPDCDSCNCRWRSSYCWGCNCPNYYRIAISERGWHSAADLDSKISTVIQQKVTNVKDVSVKMGWYPAAANWGGMLRIYLDKAVSNVEIGNALVSTICEVTRVATDSGVALTSVYLSARPHGTPDMYFNDGDRLSIQPALASINQGNLSKTNDILFTATKAGDVAIQDLCGKF